MCENHREKLERDGTMIHSSLVRWHHQKQRRVAWPSRL